MMQEMRRAQTPMAHVRVAGRVAAVQRGYVDVVNGLGQHFVRGDVHDGRCLISNAVVEQRLIAGMASVAAALAVALASVGLFGLLAYSVSSRIREIGVRVSIGATRGEVVRMIVREGLVVAIPGVRDRRAAGARGRVGRALAALRCDVPPIRGRLRARRCCSS